jgi:GNAT superfamily N-acetyltransferase
MQARDAAAVADLATQLGYPSSEVEIADRFGALKDRRDARVLVGEGSNGAIVGWIHMQITESLESGARAEIWGLVVAEPARGAGVGKALVEAGERWALSSGLKVIVVRSNTIRLEAHKFYEHLGYQVIKTQKAFRKRL